MNGKFDLLDSGSILNPKLIDEAFWIAEVAIERLFHVRTPLMLWGPGYLAVVVQHPNLEKNIRRSFGSTAQWESKWGNPEDFFKIAAWKIAKSQECDVPLSEIEFLRPFELGTGDYLYEAGSASFGRLHVGASGIKSFGDETAANIILWTIVGLCRRKWQYLTSEAHLEQLG